MNPTLTALNRFGLGARPGEPTRIGDPKAWLHGQLDGPPPLLENASVPTAETVAGALRGLRQAQLARDEAARAEAEAVEGDERRVHAWRRRGRASR